MTEDITWNVYGVVTRHLVSIFVAYTDGTGDVASGFILEIEGVWFLVTAGHVIGGFDRAIAEGRVKKCRLMDGLARHAKWRQTIPFDYGSSVRANIGNEDDFDYGLIRLGGLTLDQLKANEIVAIGKEKWTDLPNSFDQYLLFGTPTEFVKVKVTPDGEPMLTGVTPIVAEIEQVFDPPKKLVKPFARFYGRVAGTFGIGGMSGGPLLGLKVEGKEFRYWTIGVQSGWDDEGTRVLAACPFGTLVKHVQEWVKSVNG